MIEHLWFWWKKSLLWRKWCWMTISFFSDDKSWKFFCRVWISWCWWRFHCWIVEGFFDQVVVKEGIVNNFDFARYASLYLIVSICISIFCCDESFRVVWRYTYNVLRHCLSLFSSLSWYPSTALRTDLYVFGGICDASWKKVDSSCSIIPHSIVQHFYLDLALLLSSRDVL